MLLNDIKDETMQEEIERNALNGQYETKEDKTPIVTIKSRRKSVFVGNIVIIDNADIGFIPL